MTTVRVNNGRAEEFENGTIRRTFGSNIIFADTDGSTVAAVTRSGRVDTYVNGTIKANIRFERGQRTGLWQYGDRSNFQRSHRGICEWLHS